MPSSCLEKFFQCQDSIIKNELASFSIDQLAFLFNEGLLTAPMFSQKKIVVLCKDDSSIDYFQENLRLPVHFDVLAFPGLGADPFSSAICPESNLAKRWNVALKLCHSNKIPVVLCSPESLPLPLPDIELLRNVKLGLNVDDIYERKNLLVQLSKFGYVHHSLCEEPGTFSVRGEILDIFTSAEEFFRITFFDEIIESIFLVDPKTLRKISDTLIKTIDIFPTPNYFLSTQSGQNLRESIPQVQPVFKKRYDERVSLFDKIGNCSTFENFPKFFGGFFNKRVTLLDYIDHRSLFLFFENKELITTQINNIFSERVNEYSLRMDDVNVGLLPPVEILHALRAGQLESTESFLNFGITSLDYNGEASLFSSSKSMIRPYLKNELSFRESFSLFFENRDNEISSVIISAHNQRSIDEMIGLLPLENFPHLIINKIISHTFDGFYSKIDKQLFLTENDLAKGKSSRRPRHQSKAKSFNDLFSDQLSQLRKGDYVVHRDFGVGIYQGLSSLTLGLSKGDFVEIIYKGNDKVYVPVYKLHLIQKFADLESQAEVADLNSKKFENAKERASSSIKKLAFDLVKLQAERTIQKGFSFSPPSQDFYEFELSFPYDETDDQLKAIEETLLDMQSERPMDRLVCGDVGYGKTEVAIRAAFKAVLDQKQVVILVPTTILAIQHFYTFKERLKQFPVNIEHFSRLKSAKDAALITQNLKEGKIDIIVATHKILSDSIEFKDLGLVVIDEEHRFGVAHKEKLKLLRTSTDFLTLSATPIPRTLQLAFLGIKDMSLIKTPPARRQSVKTTVIREDFSTLKDALAFELSRGGQAYIVHNKIIDLDDYAAKIKKLVPDAKILTAHGQLAERELEKRIVSFFNKEYDILISTTIIESGVDIPNANTLIVDRADCFGLAQLHQLRGRIGRSDRKAYAYFVIPKDYEINPEAIKRLQALENFSELGAGFNLANVDLEIRGAGDILGPEQSGNMKTIGFESYMHLLEEAIAELKGESVVLTQNTEVQSYVQSYIPDSFIQNEALRLKYYKRLSNSSDEEIIINTLSEIEDLFGKLPDELINLGFILRSRIYLSQLGVLSCKHLSNEISLLFDEAFLRQRPEFANSLLNYLMKFPKKYKFKSTYHVSFISTSSLNCQSLYEYSKHIAQQIGTC